MVLRTSHFTGGDEGVICDITVITVREKRGAVVNRSTTVRVMRDRGGVYRFDVGYDEYAYIRCNHAVILVQYGKSGELFIISIPFKTCTHILSIYTV